MDAKIFRINYKSDFILTLTSDAGWMTPFCIKFWTGAPSQAYYAQWDGETYTHCAYDPSEPTKLTVQFDDHHLPIGELKYQVAYHFTVEDFPNDTEDEVLNPGNITTEIDGEEYKVMLDFTGETAPEIQFSLPAYANEAQRIENEQQRIANEQQRISNEEARIAAETVRQQNETTRIAQEEARVTEFARLKRESEAATGAANDAAALANQKAQLAADKAALAQAAATLAGEKAQLADDKAALADAAATLANAKAALAQQKATYAQTQGDYAKEQGDYAKAQGDYAKAQGDTAQADHERAEADHTRAEQDHTTAANDHTQAASDHTTAASDHTRAESDHTTAASDHTTATNDHAQAVTDHTTAAADHTQADNDHTRAESDHTRAESDHAAVEVYVDSLGAFDISAYHATGGVLAKYADLTAALDSNNGGGVPQSLQKGGMSVKFVQSSDNKYVQFRYTSSSTAVADFTNVTNWQGVDDKPTVGSNNLVKSGGVKEESDLLGNEIEALNVQVNGSVIETSIINNGTVYNQYISSASYQWTIAGERNCRLIPLEGYSAVKITANNTYNSSYTFIKDANLEGTAPVFASGWNNKIANVAVGSTSEKIDVPSDAVYLYVYLGVTTTFQPSHVIGYGRIADNGLVHQVADIREALTSIKELNVQGTEYDQYISSSSYQWTSGSARHCVLIPISSYYQIQITANSSYYARYSFFANPNISGTAPIYATGYSDTLIDVPANTTSDKINVPSDAKFLYIYYGSSATFMPQSIIGYSIEKTIAREFDGKTIILLGDSQLGQALDVNVRIKNVVGGNVYNWGFGGCRMSIRPSSLAEYATWNPFSAVGVAHALTTGDFTEMDAHKSDSGVPEYFADHVAEMKNVNLGDGENIIMTIAYGSNDYSGGVYLGDSDSTNTETFNGAMNEVFTSLIKAFPRMVLLLVGLPYRVYEYSSKTPEGITSDSDTATNNRGLHRYDYSDAVGIKAQELKLPFFDMYRRSGRNKYNIWTLCPSDGTHPTSEAGKQAEADLYVKILRTF